MSCLGIRWEQISKHIQISQHPCASPHRHHHPLLGENGVEVEGESIRGREPGGGGVAVVEKVQRERAWGETKGLGGGYQGRGGGLGGWGGKVGGEGGGGEGGGLGGWGVLREGERTEMSEIGNIKAKRK